MTWTRLDEGFSDHPKILAAGPMAELLHIHGLLYCNRHLTDGFIPTAALPLLKARAPYVAKLVSAGIWEKVDGGYRIHHFLEYQPSRAEVLEARTARKIAKIAGGKARAQNARRSGGRFVGNATSSEAAETSSAPAAPPAAHQQETSGGVEFSTSRDQQRTSPVPSRTRIESQRMHGVEVVTPGGVGGSTTPGVIEGRADPTLLVEWFYRKHGWGNTRRATYEHEMGVAMQMLSEGIELPRLLVLLDAWWDATDPRNRPSTLEYFWQKLQVEANEERKALGRSTSWVNGLSPLVETLSGSKAST